MTVSKMELAKTLKSIKAVTNEVTYEEVKHRLVSPEMTDEVERSIGGLVEEDEFALLCKLMGTSTHLINLEQRPIIPGDYIVPDFFARFDTDSTLLKLKSNHRGYCCLIDVKSTDKKEI